MSSENQIEAGRYMLPKPRTVIIDNFEFYDTLSAFDHIFGNTAGVALNWHLNILEHDYNPKYPYNFGKHKEEFVKGLQEIIRRRTSVSKGITYNRLDEMIGLAMGDWWNIETLIKLYERRCELTGRDIDETFESLKPYNR